MCVCVCVCIIYPCVPCHMKKQADSRNFLAKQGNSTSARLCY